jgi:hypothetical protein
VRIGWLIVLLLTAMTPLARAQCVVVPEESAGPSVPAESAVPTPESDDDSEEETLLPLPGPDVWDGSSSRCPVGVSGPALIASLLGYDVGVRLPLPPTLHFNRVDVVLLAEPAQDAWMACRYAHAPPLV